MPESIYITTSNIVILNNKQLNLSKKTYFKEKSWFLNQRILFINLEEAIYRDIAKAFHCVDHDLLFSKVKAYGVTGHRLNQLSRYLKERSQ